MNEETIRTEFPHPELQSIIEEYPFIQNTLKKLDEKYPKEKFPYHNREHTVEVINTAFNTAEEEYRNKSTEFPSVEKENLVIACTFHDYFQGTGHEDSSAVLIEKFLSRHYPNFNRERVDKIKKVILATKINPNTGSHAKAESIEEKAIQIADVVNFGRGDFIPKYFSIYKEKYSEEYGDNADLTDRINFVQGTLKLLKNHEWPTEVSKEKYKSKKQENIQALEDELKDLRKKQSNN